jgi:hypothetical protein
MMNLEDKRKKAVNPEKRSNDVSFAVRCRGGIHPARALLSNVFFTGAINHAPTKQFFRGYKL